MASRRRSLGGTIVMPNSIVADGAVETIERPAEAGPIAAEAFYLESRFPYEAFKRAIDVIAALVGLILTLPLLIVIAVLVRLDSRGPILIRQPRLGKDARPFGMLKFRSMYENGGDIPPELLKDNESSGPLFKMKRDPRITRVGRFLRRASLDELPQLWNVLVGEMSLVGPRPPLARELAGYDTVQRLRLRVVPGLTGLWQVSGRSDLVFDEMVQLDLRYIEERSLWLDLTILLRTVPCVLTGRGAY